MYVGHYAAAFLLKTKAPTLSLGWLFLAVQFVDIIYFPLTLLGIERFNIIENYTASTHFELVYMPFTHSLLASVIWAGVIYILLYKFFQQSRTVAFVVALAVLSHWFFDLLVHTPDLPIWSDTSIKVGFGLWNNAYLAFALETVLLLGALVYCLHLKNDASQKLESHQWRLWMFVLLLILANAINIFGPLIDNNPTSFAVTALATYFIFAALAFYIDSGVSS